MCVAQGVVAQPSFFGTGNSGSAVKIRLPASISRATVLNCPSPTASQRTDLTKTNVSAAGSILRLDLRGEEGSKNENGGQGGKKPAEGSPCDGTQRGGPAEVRSAVQLCFRDVLHRFYPPAHLSPLDAAAAFVDAARRNSASGGIRLR